MNGYSKKETQEILEKNDLGALKRLGQNFLVDKNIIKKISNLAKPNDTILEIGPGLGALTIPLSIRAKNIIAIEKDKKFASLLESQTKNDYPNIQIIENDFLKSENLLPQETYKVFGNIPFYITSRIIRFLLESKNPPEEIVFLMQKEVAKRICSKPPKMNLLAISVQVFAEPKILFYVSRNSFWPTPKVDCAILQIKKKKENLSINISDFFVTVKAGFSHPRAQLLNNLSKELKLKKEKVSQALIASKIDPKQRAESLSLEDWREIQKNIKK